MSSGYVAGATSSWWVQRKVKREVERLLPTNVVGQVTDRVSAVGDRALERTVQSPVTQTANRAIQKVRPDIDITDRAMSRLDSRRKPILSVVDNDLHTQAGVRRLRERSRKFRT